jgi:hypothetical protein
MMQPPEALAPAAGYERVRALRSALCAAAPQRPHWQLTRAAAPRARVFVCVCVLRRQIMHLQSGAFGMAYLERDLTTGEQVAIKYIPRGATVRRCCGAALRDTRKNAF